MMFSNLFIGGIFTLLYCVLLQSVETEMVARGRVVDDTGRPVTSYEVSLFSNRAYERQLASGRDIYEISPNAQLTDQRGRFALVVEGEPGVDVWELRIQPRLDPGGRLFLPPPPRYSDAMGKSPHDQIVLRTECTNLGDVVPRVRYGQIDFRLIGLADSDSRPRICVGLHRLSGEAVDSRSVDFRSPLQIAIPQGSWQVELSVCGSAPFFRKRIEVVWNHTQRIEVGLPAGE